MFVRGIERLAIWEKPTIVQTEPKILKGGNSISIKAEDERSVREGKSCTFLAKERVRSKSLKENAKHTK